MRSRSLRCSIWMLTSKTSQYSDRPSLRYGLRAWHPGCMAAPHWWWVQIQWRRCQFITQLDSGCPGWSESHHRAIARVWSLGVALASPIYFLACNPLKQMWVWQFGLPKWFSHCLSLLYCLDWEHHNNHIAKRAHTYDININICICMWSCAQIILSRFQDCSWTDSGNECHLQLNSAAI